MAAMIVKVPRLRLFEPLRELFKEPPSSGSEEPIALAYCLEADPFIF